MEGLKYTALALISYIIWGNSFTSLSSISQLKNGYNSCLSFSEHWNDIVKVLCKL